MFLESFALRSDLLLPIAAKVGKSARRDLRFLHLPALLPLMPTPNSALAPTVENVSGSGARGADDSSYVTITTGFCERAVKGIKYERRHSVGGFLNRRFKLSFWVLLGQRPKVPRARKRETSSLPPLPKRQGVWYTKTILLGLWGQRPTECKLQIAASFNEKYTTQF